MLFFKGGFFWEDYMFVLFHQITVDVHIGGA